MKRPIIEFPAGEESYYPVQTAIKFPAVVDGRTVLCFIEIATLACSFEGVEKGRGIDVFQRHRPEIESIVRTMVENGYVNTDGELFIRGRDFAIFQENAAGK